jgi:hypothetical protein
MKFEFGAALANDLGGSRETNFPMCSRYTYTKDEAKLRLRDLIVVFGAVRAPASAPA